MRIRLTREEKKIKAFYSGLGLLILGFYLIFILKNNWGFVSSFIGFLLIFWRF